MDQHYHQIQLLTEEYIRLNNEFLQSLQNDEPAEKLSYLKEKIRNVFEQIEILEKHRESNPLDARGLTGADNI